MADVGFYSLLLQFRGKNCILLTIQCESGGAGHPASVVGGHAGVLALVLGVNSGDLQLTAVVKLRHPEEV